jgi:hypothetical protein
VKYREFTATVMIPLRVKILTRRPNGQRVNEKDAYYVMRQVVKGEWLHGNAKIRNIRRVK